MTETSIPVQPTSTNYLGVGRPFQPYVCVSLKRQSAFELCTQQQQVMSLIDDGVGPSLVTVLVHKLTRCSPHNQGRRGRPSLADMVGRPPGWEDVGIVDASTPLLGAQEDTGDDDRRPAPYRSREWLVYLAFLALGLGTLLPWNFFITAESYWQYKFRNTTDGLQSVVALHQNESVTAPPSLPAPRTELQLIYTPMLVCLSQITNFSFLIINAVFSHRLPIRQRLLSTLTAMLVMFAVTTALVKVDSDSWQTGFFALTMTIVVLLNGSGALFQGGLFGLAGMFPPRFMTAVVTGQALGGVFASLARIISLLAGADDITSAFIFFMIAVGVMVFTMGALYYLCNTEMYHHYTSPNTIEKTEDGTEEERQPLTASQLAAHSSRVFRQIWPLGLSIVCVFWVTLAVFPAVCVKIVSTSTDTQWGGTYFQPVLTFLLFNVGDYVGRQLAGSLMWPKRGSPLVMVLVLLRLVFIPLLLLCNHPGSSSSIPSVFTSDIAYFFIMSLFALSNGYGGSICMIYGPMSVSDPKDAERAGSLMAAMLGLGLLLGAATSFGFGMIL